MVGPDSKRRMLLTGPRAWTNSPRSPEIGGAWAGGNATGDAPTWARSVRVEQDFGDIGDVLGSREAQGRGQLPGSPIITVQEGRR